MSYFKLLGLEKEPFSSSPDPEFLYLSREYDLALTNILIELRLKRGLTVILGDVGTGKTTLSRKLVKELSEREDFIFHVILNPIFESEKEFLFALTRNFEVPLSQSYQNITVSEIRDSFEKFLLHNTRVKNKTVVVIIDEAQKLSEKELESLRILLNYETNEYKLIQLVLLGQLELYSRILQMSNFYDRIDFKYTLNPLGYEETKEMIVYRLSKAGYMGNISLFLDEAIRDIYYYTKGYPRGIIRVCHKCLRALVMSKVKTVVDKQLVFDVIEEDSVSKWRHAGVKHE
ncbi:MAG: AAA family ATPase [Candidatus Omnitrophica bacterium]|jgi:general secretion pathway protein A|nr:AAA family ATPase [Candidatus Omnitrophota bacterium]MDD5080930.1 AAA family ATPase [Candidatus Omnitrophota bacterium]